MSINRIMEVYYPNSDAIITHLMTLDNFNANLTSKTVTNPSVDNSVQTVDVTSITVIDNHQDGNIIKVLYYAPVNGLPAYLVL
jgi:hypothetical protein